MALTDKLTTIANAIRSKTGKSDALTLDQMATEIESISAGGDDRFGALLDLSITEIVSDVTVINKAYLIAGLKSLECVKFPKVLTIGQYAFSNGSATGASGYGYEGYFPECQEIRSYAFANEVGVGPMLKKANFPKVKNISSYAFYKNALLEEVFFPECTSVGTYAFGSNQGTNKVKIAAFPKLETLQENSFGGWWAVKVLDLGAPTSIPRYCFSGDYLLVSIVLRTQTMCTLANANGLYNCYHFNGTTNTTFNPDGLKDGYIYVPYALIEEYKAATNWSTFAEQFRALEDYTVDGTTTGELDLAKMGVDL